MKVSTDSCILGAWFAERVSQAETILDIGSGTGLLMMMLAQKAGSAIHGIEVDPSCFKQLQENIKQCDWKDRLLAIPEDVRNFTSRKKYEFIISNPPFYENDLTSPDEQANLARHGTKLSLKELIGVIDTNLSTYGTFGVLLPYNRCGYFNTLTEERHFYLREKVCIRHSPAHPFSRAILHYSRTKENHSSISEMSIRRDGGEYSNDFVDLLKDYYLYL